MQTIYNCEAARNCATSRGNCPMVKTKAKICQFYANMFCTDTKPERNASLMQGQYSMRGINCKSTSERCQQMMWKTSILYSESFLVLKKLPLNSEAVLMKVSIF
jgi:hypothetical protein